MIEIDYDKNGPDSRESFRMFEDGQFKGKNPITCQPNILKGVITGKKSWGLWLDQWTDGISEGLFKKEEILSEFENLGIKIPESFLKDFENTIRKKKFGC